MHLTVRYAIDRPPEVVKITVDSPDRKARALNASDLRIPLDAYAQYAAALALHLSGPIDIRITQGGEAIDTSAARFLWATPILREHTRVAIRPTTLVSLGKTDPDPDEHFWMTLENRQLALFNVMLAEMKTRATADKSVRRVAAPDQELQRAADIYRQSIEQREPPTRTIAEALHVSDATAWRRIQRAIDTGYLDRDVVKRRRRRK